MSQLIKEWKGNGGLQKNNKKLINVTYCEKSLILITFVIYLYYKQSSWKSQLYVTWMLPLTAEMNSNMAWFTNWPDV